jgi:hypothetical protein
MFHIVAKWRLNTSSCSLLIFTHLDTFVNATKFLKGARVALVGWGATLQAERLRVRFPMRSLKFSIHLILQTALWPRTWFSYATIQIRFSFGFPTLIINADYNI